MDLDRTVVNLAMGFLCFLRVYSAFKMAARIEPFFGRDGGGGGGGGERVRTVGVGQWWFVVLTKSLTKGLPLGNLIPRFHSVWHPSVNTKSRVMAGRMIYFTLQCIAISSLSMFVLSVKECKKIDSCSCSTDEGEISLKKLAGTGGKPK